MLAEGDITAALRTLGLDGESILIVHSSPRSFGDVQGGAASVANALASTCGTVVVPSGTWDATGVPAPPGQQRPNHAAISAGSWAEFDAAVEQAAPFSKDMRIDKELGAIPEALRRGFRHIRGQLPPFSFLAVGLDANEVIGGERLDWPLGPVLLLATVAWYSTSHTKEALIGDSV